MLSQTCWVTGGKSSHAPTERDARAPVGPRSGSRGPRGHKTNRKLLLFFSRQAMRYDPKWATTKRPRGRHQRWEPRQRPSAKPATEGGGPEPPRDLWQPYLSATERARTVLDWTERDGEVWRWWEMACRESTAARPLRPVRGWHGAREAAPTGQLTAAPRWARTGGASTRDRAR